MKTSGPKVAKLFTKDIKDIRLGLIPMAVDHVTHVTCVAISKDTQKNVRLHLPLHKCLPVAGYAYSQVNDTYTFNCYMSLDLGFIPIAYRLKIDSVGAWTAFVPMPESVLKRYMTPEQRRNLAHFKSSLRDEGEDVVYEYVQMLSAYPYG